MTASMRRAGAVRTLLIVVAFVVVEAAIFGFGVVIALEKRADPVSAVLTAAVIGLFLIGPIVLGGLHAYWRPGSSLDGRRFFHGTADGFGDSSS